MYPIVRNLHSITAYLLVASTIFVILLSIIQSLRRKPFQKSHLKYALICMTLSHIQLIIGIALYFLSPLGFRSISKMGMKISYTRLYFLEHPMMMIIGIILLTIGYSRAKRLRKDSKRYNTLIVFYLIGLIMILSRIPWQAWP